MQILEQQPGTSNPIERVGIATDQELRSISIEASKGWSRLKLKEIWEFRELLYFLVWRDIKVRYKQTILGAGWALIQPLFTMVIFSIFFGRLAKIPSDGIPYPLFALCGLVPWTYFSNTLTQGANSLVGNAGLVKKVYFPRLDIPIAKGISALLDFALAFALLIGMALYYGVHPTVRILTVPFFLLLAMMTALGSAFWLSAINVRIRDVEQTLPFLTQIWMYATPIAYPSSLLPEPWRTIFGLNPMVSVVEGFRWALLGANTRPGAMTLLSSAVGVALLLSGAFGFRRLERTFADIL